MAYTTIDDPSAYFHTQLYTGNGSSTHAITNNANSGNFKPDYLWIKQRSQGGRPHSNWDSTRGTSQRIQANSSGAEETHADTQSRTPQTHTHTNTTNTTDTQDQTRPERNRTDTKTETETKIIEQGQTQHNTTKLNKT